MSLFDKMIGKGKGKEKKKKLKPVEATCNCIVCGKKFYTKHIKYIISVRGIKNRKELTWFPCCSTCKNRLMKGMIMQDES